jgi:hypothetical protein
MIRYLVVLAGLAPLLIQPASAGCRHIGPLVQFGDGREPQCITTSDGAGQPYVDDRKRQNSDAWRRSVERRRAWREGATHTSDMASGGTRMNGILVSPFVPGSTQDKAWQSERKRKGLCGTDRLCLNQ